MQLPFNQHECTRLKEPLLPKIPNGIMVYSYNQTDVVVTVPYLQNVLVYQTLLKVTLLKIILKTCHIAIQILILITV